MTKVVQDISILRQKSENVNSVDEAKDIISKLENVLGEIGHGVGLAAIQLGYPKRIGVIKDNHGSYFHLINPEIIEKSDEFVYFREGCLSFPEVYFSTNRYKQITVRNHVIIDDKFEEEIFVAYYSADEEMGNDGLLAIAIQHEVDHFDSILIHDREVKLTPIKRDNEKVGRNDKCPCNSGKKYKKCCGK